VVNIYVGNLPFSTTEQDLQQMFGAHGQVSRASIVMDRETGRSRGFGFVEMPNDAEGNAAIAALNGKDMNGRGLTVNVAKPREGGGGGGGGGRGGGGGGRRGGW
jgi:RNA recognition motif-containing protein